MNKQRTVVLGNGFLGSAFKQQGYDVWGRDKFEWGREDGTDELMELMNHNKWSQNGIDKLTIINCIGISDTRFCEDPKNWGLIKSVNGDLPSWLSYMCSHHNVKLVHINTGCIYSNKSGVCTEDTFITPMCRYTVSKTIGLYECDMSRDIIINPRLLFDSSKVVNRRNNLIQKFDKFDTFLNEFNSVTSLDTIIESVDMLVENNCSGMFNVCNSGIYTIAQMAKHLGFDVDSTIQESDLHNSQDLYLVNNVMSTDKLTNATGYVPRDTLEELHRCYNIIHNL